MRPARWAALALLAAPAAGSVPPPPPDQAPAIAASCGGEWTRVPFPILPARLARPAPLPLGDKARLRVAWGVRIVTGDPRVADLIGLQADRPSGLLAATRGGWWLSLALHDGGPAELRGVGIAAMKGLPAPPTSVADLGFGGPFVVHGGAHPGVVRYALAACGARSTALPWLTLDAGTDPVAVTAGYSYLGLAARRETAGAALVLPYAPATVTLAAPNPLAMPGRRLVAATNPVTIVPAIVGAWQVAGGQRTVLRLVTVDAWSDVRGGPPGSPIVLADLPRPPAAITSLWARDTGTLSLFVVMPAPGRGAIDLYRLDGKVAL